MLTAVARSFNDKEKMSHPKEVFSAVMVTYYIRALEHNHLTNDKRVRLYKRGWIFAMISLGLFVCYICLNQSFPHILPKRVLIVHNLLV